MAERKLAVQPLNLLYRALYSEDARYYWLCTTVQSVQYICLFSVLKF